MAEGAGRIADFSKVYRQRAHENQRIGMTPQSMPRLEEVDDMVKQNEKIQISLQRMREVVFNHQQASYAEPPRESHYRPANGFDHDGQNSFHEDPKSSGGFAGLDPNKRPKRGVSFTRVENKSYLTVEHSEPLRLVDATAAIGLKPQNGAVALMVQELFATPAVYVSSLLAEMVNVC
jgi:hypothetical protein